MYRPGAFAYAARTRVCGASKATHAASGVLGFRQEPQAAQRSDPVAGPGHQAARLQAEHEGTLKYGSPVEWHQDWAFYPHTNDDLLAVGVMLDDMELENGPLLVLPGTH